MKNFFTKYYLYIEIIVLFFLSLTPLLWFKPEHIVIGIDSGYPVDYVGYFNQRVFTWLGSQNFGIDMSTEVGIVPYNGLSALIKTLGVSQFDVQKVLFIFWFFLILIAIYSLVKYLFPKREQWIIRFVATVIYAFNLHIYSFWLQGEQPILASYVLLPLFALFFLRFVRRETTAFKSAVYLNILFALLSSGGIRGVPLVAPVIFTTIIIFVYYFVISFNEKIDYIKRFIPLVFWGLIFFVLLNAYFLIPFLSSFSVQFQNQVAIAGGLSGAVDWAKFISRYTSFTNLFRLHGDNNWYDKPYLWSWSYLTNPFLIFASFLFPFLAYLAPLFTKNKKEKLIIILFVVISLTGLFLSEGAHPPLGYIYIQLMEKIPGFAAFRSAYYKFIPMVYLSFSILIGYSSYNLMNKISKRYVNLLGVIAVLLILAYNFPYFTNINFGFNRPFSTMIKIPSYVNDFAKMENKMPDKYRTLVVPPPADVYNIKAYTWGYWGSYPLFPLITNKNFVVNDVFVYNENENNFINYLYSSLRKKDYPTFFNGARVANIKYILVTNDIAKDFYMSFTEDPAIFNKILQDKNYFKQIWSEGEWQLYEIKTIDPKKIAAEGYVNINNSGPTGIPASLQVNAFPFIESDVENNFNIPIAGNINVYPCLSCSMLDTAGKPGVITDSITPESFLYTLKISSEKSVLEGTLSNKQKIDAYLGLSLKRVGEIDNLNYMPPKYDEKWLKAANLLLSNWKQVYKLYLAEVMNSSDYQELQRIYDYLILERNTITNVINIRNLDKKSGIGKSLSNTLYIQNKIDKTLAKKINQYDWTSTFIYDVSGISESILFNKNSLPTDLDSQPLYPAEYAQGNSEKISISQEEKSNGLKLVKNDNKTITLFFNLPNLFDFKESASKKFNGSTKACLVGQILNYSGAKKYLVSVDTDDKYLGEIYFKREYDIFKTQDYADHYPKTTNYDSATQAYTAGTGKYLYQFAGSANDKSATVYFCGTSEQDPAKVFKNIKITEVVKPQIFSYKTKSYKQNSLPDISYTKINPTHYDVNIRNASKPFILTFSERYSPLWEAYVNGSVIKEHTQINGFANGWYINKNGDYKIEIKFKAQKLVNIGVVITLLSLISLISYAIFQFLKSTYDKK